MLNDVNKSLGVEYSAKLDMLAQYGEEEYNWFMNELEMMSADARNTLRSVASLIHFRLLKIEKKGLCRLSIHDLHEECMKEDRKEITQIILKRFVESDLFNPYDWSMN